MSVLIPCCFHLPFDPMPVFIPFLCWWYHARVYPVPVLILCPVLIPCMCFSCPCWSRAYVDPLVHMLFLCMCCSGWSCFLDPMHVLISCSCSFWSRAHVVLVHVLFLCTCCSCAHGVLMHMLFSCTWCSCARVVLVLMWSQAQVDSISLLIPCKCWSCPHVLCWFHAQSHAHVDLLLWSCWYNLSLAHV